MPVFNSLRLFKNNFSCVLSRDVTVTVENHFKPLVRNFVILLRLKFTPILCESKCNNKTKQC